MGEGEDELVAQVVEGIFAYVCACVLVHVAEGVGGGDVLEPVAVGVGEGQLAAHSVHAAVVHAVPLGLVGAFHPVDDVMAYAVVGGERGAEAT